MTENKVLQLFPIPLSYSWLW